MTALGPVARWLALSLAMVLAACAPARLAPPSAPANALASFVVWSPARIEPEWSLQGMPVDLVHVRGGDIVRLVAISAEPVRIAERLRSETGAAEEWNDAAPEEGVITLRATPFTTEILWPRGAVRLAYVGKGSEPGYHWFELEDRVLEWADGPLSAPFPEVAPRQRVAADVFADLDRALAEALAAAGGSQTVLDAARAIRRVAGLRAVRSLRPASGYPYFFDSRPEVRGRAPVRTNDGRLAYELTPQTPLDLVLDGPALLHVFVQIDSDDASESAEVRVLEHDRVRAVTSSTLPRSAMTTHDPLVLPHAHPRTLRRAIVHVPPGRHEYLVANNEGHALVVPLRAVPVVHLEDASVKSEDVQLDVARRTCAPPGSPALCAFALALLAEDHGGADSKPGTMPWAAAMSASPETARRLAEILAAGGPRDPTLELEATAARGDRSALEALARFADESADEGMRAAWARSTYRATIWQVADTAPERPTWLALAFDSPAGGSCASSEEDRWPEVGASDEQVPARPWHGAPAIELAVSAVCDDPTPVELVVDGERLVANPSAGLVRWHVRVQHDTARVRRLDAGRARVFAAPERLAPCGARFESIRAPRAAVESPSLTFDATALAPGVEIWLREGTGVAEVELTSHGSPRDGRRLRIVAKGQAGMAAYDEQGVRWTRVVRAVLPPWAAAGVDVDGGRDVAVRAIGRMPRDRDAAARTAKAHSSEPAPADEAELASLSREILARPAARRGEPYLRRALLLAEAGAIRGALEDAAAAEALGARGPAGERPTDLARRHARSRPPRVPAMPDGVAAYGIERDFDPGAARCRAEHDGPRARLQRAYEELSRGSHDTQPRRAYDAGLAASAVERAQGSPLDPRAPAVVGRALSGSRWKLRNDVDGSDRTTLAPRGPTIEGPIDARGELRPSVLAGRPFADGTFATVVADRPAKANVVAGPSGGAVWLDVACVARSPSRVDAGRCPLEVEVDGKALTTPDVGEDGRARVPLAAPARAKRRVELRLRKQPGRWVALVRVVFERETSGASHAEGVGWVLLPHPVERRHTAAPGEAIGIEARSAGVYRVDVVPLDSAEGVAPEVELVVDGRRRDLSADGAPVVVPMPTAGRIAVRALRGQVSVAFAERVRNEDGQDEEDGKDDQDEAREPTPPASPREGPREQPPIPGWRDAALRSPPPLGPVESSLGTTVASVGFVDGTLHTGTSSTAPDYYGFALAAYRRRIESIDLWTTFEVFGRTRLGAPTFGADGVLYEDLDRMHLRLSGSLGVEAQQIGPSLVETLRAHAFVEYSARLTRDFFVLPRLGYDGVYTSLRNVPPTLSFVDSEVFDPYRYERPSFLFAQALFWYAPFFDDIFYLRTRATWNAYASTFSHLALRPGGFFVLGNVDLTGYLDALWYAPSDSPVGQARWEETVGVIAEYDRWWGMGSVCVQPGLAGYAHLHDSGWQVNAFVNVFLSERRGLRDFSSLELDFPEQRSGGIPWRGSTPGGYQ